MGRIAEQGEAAFRDNAAAGVPASGDHEPVKAEIRTWARTIDNAVTGLAAAFATDASSVVYAQQSQLFAYLVPDAGTLAIVYGDTPDKNGIYIKQGATGTGSWAPTGLLLEGPKGDDGRDLYQIALDTGYIPMGSTETEFINAIVGQVVAEARAARDKARDWAESGTAPAGGSTKSSKTWAGESAQSAAASATARNIAMQYRDTTIQTANTAQAAFLTLGQLYQTVSSGLAATAPNGYFAVAGTGEIFATVYQKVNNAAALVNVLASQSALDRVGRFVPNIANVDNAAAMNAALAQPLVSGVFIPPGDIEVRSATVIPSAKFLRGAGRGGVTRLIATTSLPDIPNVGKAVVIANGATGVQVSDLTVVAPKFGVGSTEKVQGVWMRNTKYFLVERVDAFNCGYSFWAHEFSQFGAFRDIGSYNGNVHFEATRASDILFDRMRADDGDGDNPLGVEATWHCLFGSKRITFRNGLHRGKGSPFLVVADSGAGDEGLIDQIRFENCKSKQLDDKIAFFASKITPTASIGRVDVVDCDLDATGGGGIPLQVQLGEFYFKGGNWRGNAQEFCMLVGSTATLEWENPNLYMDPAPGANGYFFSGKSTVRGGRATTTSPLIDLSTGLEVKAVGAVDFIAPAPKGKAFAPLATQSSGFVFTADRQYAFTETFGQMADEGKLQIALVDGATYRVRFVGRMKKSASGARRVGVYIDGIGGTLISGSLTADVAAAPAEQKRFSLYANGRTVDYADGMSSAGFELAMVVRGNGGTMTLSAPDGDVILMAGSEFTIERLA